MAVNSGQKFQYAIKSKIGAKTHTIKEREMKPPCTDKCRLKCKETFPEEVQKQIFTSFYATGERTLQTTTACKFGYRAINGKKRGTDPENSRRNFSSS